MNTHYFTNWLPAFKRGNGSRALVAAPATVESQEGLGTRTAIMAGTALLIGLIIVVAETYFDNLRGHAVAPATSRTK
ncbi:MAG TPA: hypothetical protein VI457_00530 [Methylococcaceae bacterium]|nr:hypothetical protein [Methylococcaceae bacterium]